MTDASLFFRAVECDDGTWSCRHGRQEYDRHTSFDDALDHITKLATEHRPAEVFVHHLDGRAHSVAVFDEAEPPPPSSP